MLGNWGSYLLRFSAVTHISAEMGRENRSTSNQSRVRLISLPKLCATISHV